MPTASKGDTVRVHYTGKLKDGTVFDTSTENEPLEFTLGEQQVIPGFESAVMGMSPGDSKTVEIPPSQAYGRRRDDMTTDIPLGQFPEDSEPEEGDQYQVVREGGQRMIVTVTDVSEDAVTVDANHPLAGEHLVFDIELVELNP